MITDELLDYIKDQLAQGKSQDEIRGLLLTQGRYGADINLAFSKVMSSQTTNERSPSDVDAVTELQQEKPKNIFDFKNLKWYEWLALLPALFLLLQGGAIGAIIGFVGWGLILKSIRNESRSKGVKIFIVIGITIGYYLIYFILAAFVLGLVQGIFGTR